MFNIIFVFKILLVLILLGISQQQQQQKSQKEAKTESEEQDSCYNPNQTTGKCVSIYYCKVLYEILEKEPLLDNDISFLQASQCINGIGQIPYVCCTNETSYTFNTTNIEIKPLSTNHLLIKHRDSSKLPTASECGLFNLTKRIFNGKDAILGEFQWMAILEYKDKNETVFRSCAGSLINSKYILTAAHCIKGKNLENDVQLISVRLGEHDLRTVLDCVNPKLPNTCADKPVTIEIDEIIPHERYNENSPDRHHDIGLIRLKNHVNYTNYIGPVCLPSTVNLLRTIPGEKLTVSGWGRTTTFSQADIKQKLQVPVVNQTVCTTKFETQNIKIIDNQLCAGGEFNKDSCNGDSGGPLMKMGSNWVIEGIVSFGYKCGVENWPAIYTRVSGYEDWIKSKLKP